MNQKQKQILDFLKKEKRASISKIAIYVGLPIHYAEKYLEELRLKKIVIKEEETNATYWRFLSNDN